MWVQQTCDALPVPECALGVSFFEASGMCRAVGTAPSLHTSCVSCFEPAFTSRSGTLN